MRLIRLRWLLPLAMIAVVWYLDRYDCVRIFPGEPGYCGGACRPSPLLDWALPFNFPGFLVVFTGEWVGLLPREPMMEYCPPPPDMKPFAIGCAPFWWAVGRSVDILWKRDAERRGRVWWLSMVLLCVAFIETCWAGFMLLSDPSSGYPDWQLIFAAGLWFGLSVAAVLANLRVRGESAS